MIKLSQVYATTGESNAIGLMGGFDVSVTGTFVGTVVLERSLDGGTTYGTVATYTAPTEATLSCANPCLYRFNCTAYTSGSVVCRIGAGAF